MLRSIRESSNPFALSEQMFIRYFRLSRAAARELIEVIRPFGNTKNIPFDLAVLGVLMFLAKGSYQKNIGISSLYSVSQSTVSRNLHEIVDLIVTHVMPNEIRFPSTADEFNDLITGYRTKFNGLMPEIWGVIDGSLISIVSPPKFSRLFAAQAYRTRKGFTGLNIVVISQADSRFSYVNARFPGSCHDSAIFRTSLARLKLLEEFQLTGQNRGVLLGDQGFGVEPWLFPPLPRANLNPAERAYNRAHKEVRMTVENAIGDMKNIFRCLLSDRTLHYHPTFAGKIVYAVATLHNFRIRHRVPIDLDESERIVRDTDEGGHFGDDSQGDGANGPQPTPQRRRIREVGDLFSEEGNRKRDQYIRNHFLPRVV